MTQEVTFGRWEDAGDGEWEREVVFHDNDLPSPTGEGPREYHAIIARVLVMPDGTAEAWDLQGTYWEKFSNVVLAERWVYELVWAKGRSEVDRINRESRQEIAVINHINAGGVGCG